MQGQALAFWHSALPHTLSERLAALLADPSEGASTWVLVSSCRCRSHMSVTRFCRPSRGIQPAGYAGATSVLGWVLAHVPLIGRHSLAGRFQGLALLRDSSLSHVCWLKMMCSFSTVVQDTAERMRLHLLPQGPSAPDWPKTLMQKERLEELWPRSTSSLLLRLSADEPGYDVPIFDTGEGQLIFHCLRHLCCTVSCSTYSKHSAPARKVFPEACCAASLVLFSLRLS